ncbi:MAG: hypothetical protein MdMp014T_1541 [Treponematales bacterium]
MVNLFVIITITAAAIASGCAGLPGAKASGSPASGAWGREAAFTSSLPGESGLVFIGVSPKMTYRADAEALALKNAAYKVACFHAVTGSYAAYTSDGAGGFWDFASEAGSELDPDEEDAGAYESYLDSLEYDPAKDVWETGNAVLVRARYTGASLALEYRPEPRGDGEPPRWREEPPRIPGFSAGIGVARRRTYHSDTIKDSYINAAIALITEINPSVKGDAVDYTGYGRLREHIAMSGSAALSQFYALDIWTDASGNVWTLAIARTP